MRHAELTRARRCVPVWLDILLLVGLTGVDNAITLPFLPPSSR
jgi:hypothetical protein